MFLVYFAFEDEEDAKEFAREVVEDYREQGVGMAFITETVPTSPTAH
jgi:uncharacterized protein involved in tolerance to divalent cations